MNAIRIKRHIDSETLVLPEIHALIGKDVEIIFLEEERHRLAEKKRVEFADLEGTIDLDEDTFWHSREISKS